jgi:carbonic anhydrase/acetyltransferase-like protein (isoleucine patch superfamily)
MDALKKLFDRILLRNQINLRELSFDATTCVGDLLPLHQMTKFYAFYGITPHHSLNFQFQHSSLAGSYFLGKCRAINSILYKSDIRGDELKHAGDVYRYDGFEVPVSKDEEILIEDSLLIKTLVHNYSHDPETPERFFITDTIATHFSNIHGAPSDGSFLGPFATVDLTTMRDCVIGSFSYVQAGEIYHIDIDPGTIWVRAPEVFNFLYRHPLERLRPYVAFTEGRPPTGIFMDFMEARKEDFLRVFEVLNPGPSIPVPGSASLDRFAVVKPKTRIGENVLVAQRAFLENAWLGKGANAQENCYIVNSRLEGNNVTAHGAKIIETDLDRCVFVGFNSFLRGRVDGRLSIGKESIVMPHTIIDIDAPLSIPEGTLVWGLINNRDDLEANSMPVAEFSKVDGGMTRGAMTFEGSGAAFVTAFRDRIHHILEANGAFFDGTKHRGHAQKNQNISFNTIQPYPDGELEGLYPTIVIQP